MSDDLDVLRELRQAEVDLLPGTARVQQELHDALSRYVGVPTTEAVRVGVERAAREVLGLPVTVVVDEAAQNFKVVLGEPGR